MGDPKYFNQEYEERPYQEAVNWYGVKYRRAEVEVGEPVYRLVKLQEKFGTHSLITQVVDGEGHPMEGKRVAFYWPDAPEFPFPSEHDWYSNFEVGLTNLNGEVGPGMGSGAWIDVDPNPPHHAIMCGPHKVWIHDPDIPSDICECLGMRGGTNHDHLDQKFQLVIAGEDENGGNNDDCGWTMEIQKEAKPGARILIGRGLPVDTPVTVSFHNWSTTVIAGSKPEYGAGAWLVNIWNPGVHRVNTLDCEFKVNVDHNQIAWLTFIEGTPPPPKMRVVSDWIPQPDAEELLRGLEEGDYQGVFHLEAD